MLSIQECTSKSEQQIRDIKACLDKGVFHPSMLETPIHPEVMQTLRNIPLSELLMRTGTASTTPTYLLPIKVYDNLILASKRNDIMPLISRAVYTNWQGGDVDVPVISDGMYRPRLVSTGATFPSTEPTAVKATMAMKTFTTTLRITDDMIDDSQFDLMDELIRTAGDTMGRFASELGLKDLIAGADGDGTLNSSATGDADETKWTGGATADIDDAFAGLEDDWFIADTMVITPEAWHHSASTTGLTLADIIPFALSFSQPAEGFDMKLASPSNIAPIDVLVSCNPALHAAVDTEAMTNCVTILFDRDNALLTGRKRWMQIENYSDPVKDLTEAVITCRQDAVTLYKDSIYVLTES